MPRAGASARDTLAVSAALLLIAVVALLAPLLGGAIAVAREPVGDAPVSPSAALALRTLAVSMTVGALATLLALPASWSMRRLRARTSALLVAPLLLPSFLVYASWGLLRAPGRPLGDLINPRFPETASLVQALLGLSLWAWPVAALVIGSRAVALDRDEVDALRAAPVSRTRRALTTLALLRPGVVAAFAVVTLLMLGSAVPLHVAQVETWAIAVWRALAETGGSAAAWALAAPLVVLALAAGALIASRLTRPAPAGARAAVEPDRAVSTGWIIGAGLIWAVSTLVPLALMVFHLREARSLARAWPLLGESVVDSLRVGAIVALGALLIATASALAFSAPVRSWPRRLASIALALWLVGALTPGVLVGSGLATLGTTGPLRWLGDGPAGVALAHLARFGFVAALAGWWLARLEPPALRDARLLEGAGARAWLAGPARAHAWTVAAGALAVGLLSLHEIEAAVMLAPPGADPLARRLLDMLHYLRVEELTAASIWMMSLGLAAALLVAMLPARTLRSMRRAAPLLVLALAALLTACAPEPKPGAPIDAKIVFGEVGRSRGQFVYPRVIAPGDDRLWVIDRSGRVQGFTPAGEHAATFELPAYDRGFPVGATVGPGGDLYIADTHQQRVLVVDLDPASLGAVVRTWGAYGEGPGEFIYPTDVAFALADDGSIERVYVSEYGGNDRVSCFDARGNFLFAFGDEGSSASPDDVRFSRPQSLLYLPERDELLVADAANHRVGRFTPDGELIEWFGEPGAVPGDAPGGFRYPYGLASLDDGTVLVCEFGASRVQRIDPESGACLGVYGRPGRGTGELAKPWAVATLNGLAYVMDSGNSRVVAFEPPPARPVEPEARAAR